MITVLMTGPVLSVIYFVERMTFMDSQKGTKCKVLQLSLVYLYFHNSDSPLITYCITV